MKKNLMYVGIGMVLMCVIFAALISLVPTEDEAVVEKTVPTESPTETLVPPKETAEPTVEPTLEPTVEPTLKPTVVPTVEPTPEPSGIEADGFCGDEPVAGMTVAIVNGIGQALTDAASSGSRTDYEYAVNMVGASRELMQTVEPQPCSEDVYQKLGDFLDIMETALVDVNNQSAFIQLEQESDLLLQLFKDTFGELQ